MNLDPGILLFNTEIEERRETSELREKVEDPTQPKEG